MSVTEESFSDLLPLKLRQLSWLYFTPVHVAREAAAWLTADGCRDILDIGAGVGKFCVVGASTCSCRFHGIEYRPSLANLANTLIRKFELANAVVLNQDVVDTDFSCYDAFYMFNPFFENITASRALNDEIELSVRSYTHYYRYTEEQLDRAKSGTRLVTYHGNNFEVPSSYSKVRESSDGYLKLWIRQ
jgi:predicted RNA methylase